MQGKGLHWHLMENKSSAVEKGRASRKKMSWPVITIVKGVYLLVVKLKLKCLHLALHFC